MTKFNIELQPIRVPNYILVKVRPKPRQDGFNPSTESSSYHVSELDKETLLSLLEEFKVNLFKKAGIE